MDQNALYRMIGRAVAAQRAGLGLTQAVVAQRMGLTRASIANIETGRQKMPVHHIYSLANALELQSVYDLLPGHIPASDYLPIDATEVTSTQFEQVERLIRNAVAHGQPTP